MIIQRQGYYVLKEGRSDPEYAYRPNDTRLCKASVSFSQYALHVLAGLDARNLTRFNIQKYSSRQPNSNCVGSFVAPLWLIATITGAFSLV